MRLFAGELFDGTAWLGPAVLEVRHGAVVAVTPGAGGRPAADDLDLRDRAVLPAFVNAHTHLGMTVLRHVGEGRALAAWLDEAILPREERLTAEDVYWSARLALAEAARGGVGTVADMYFHMEAVAEAVLESGLRAALARGLVGEGEAFATRLAEAEALFARHGEDGRLRIFYGPHAPYSCPPASLVAVREAARRRGAVVHIHLNETEAEVAECRRRHGAPPLALLARLGFGGLPLLAAHMVVLDPEDEAALPNLDLAAAFCPVSNMALGSGLPPIARYQEIAPAMPRALGTDGAAPSGSLDFYIHLKALGWAEKVRRRDPSLLPATQVLRMATSEGGRALRWPGLGRLTPGAPADFQALDLARLGSVPVRHPAAAAVLSATAEAVTDLYVAGRPVLRHGTLVGVDVPRLLAEVEGRARRLEAELGGQAPGG